MKKEGYLISLIALAAFFVVWQVGSDAGSIPAALVSSPYQVFLKLMRSLSDGSLAGHGLASLKVLSAGLLMALAVGVPGGVLLSGSKKLFYSTRPFIFALNSLPMVALLPLVVIWFGLGFVSKAVVVFIMSFLPVIISAYEGGRNTDPELLRMARSFGAGRFAILYHVIFRGALPYIFSGVKIASGRAIIGLVVAEMFGYGKGLGYLLSFYGSTGAIAGLMMVCLILLLFNLSLLSAINYFEKKLIIK